jgi:hypothetical protein
MMNSINLLDVTSKPRYDDLLISSKYIMHYPLASSTYATCDEIRFQIENQNDFWLPSQSYITIEGTITKNPATSNVRFVRNGGLYLFNECKYLSNGIEVDRTRGLGIATTLKGLCSLSPDKVIALNNAGWSNFPENQAEVEGNHFSLCIPLRLILGFAEDYKKILLSARQELIFIRSNTDRNALVSTTAAEASTVNITKMTWLMPSVGVSDKARISLLNVINKDIPISIPFRLWDYHENPLLPQTSEFSWTITSMSQFERPRYVLVGFQTARKDRYPALSDQFDHVQVTNIKLFLNSEVFPYTNLNLNFNQHKYAYAYQMFTDFQKSYYSRELPSPCMEPSAFGTTHPIFVIDCSKQNERLKIVTTDIRLEVQTAEAIPANTSCHCLILHEKIIEYTPLSNIVRKL